jgi:DNA-binding XRE family transcriptional regulator
MSAADSATEGGTTAALVIAALRTDVFDALTAKLGATTEVQRARLIGVDRATIRRMRERQFAPRLAIAMRMAETLGTTVDDLFEQVAA